MRGRPAEVFLVFLKLGCISFGGPVAHIGYFRDEFVGRLKWIDDKAYAELVALCQFLPGPASSQVGFAIGLRRTGTLSGGLAAFLGFTLPSAIAMAALGLGIASFDATGAVVHGLKLVAVAIVAQAVWGMARPLLVETARWMIAVASFGFCLLIAHAIAQIGVIALGLVAGWAFCAPGASVTPHKRDVTIGRKSAMVALTLAVLLLVLPAAMAPLLGATELAFFDAFYRSGAMVFGGGHVVLPLLEAAVVAPGWVSPERFLAGYGLAQAMPGPLFTFASYLGAAAYPPYGGSAGAVVATLGLFLPGLLLVYGALPFASELMTRKAVSAAMQGATAAVVGLLAAALYDPVMVSAIHAPADAGLALIGFLALVLVRAPAWQVVLVLPAMSVALHGLS